MRPEISYRDKEDNGGVKPGPTPLPNALTQSKKITLLIHGYNNDYREAYDSYKGFLRRMKKVTGNVVEVYWPGDGWNGPLFYMKAISRAKQVGKLLADDLYNAAMSLGYLHVNIAAHSLGSRVTLETIKALLKKQATSPRAPIVIGNVTFMAGAVATHYLEVNGDSNSLREAFEAFQKTMNLYSDDDVVLHYAFPGGQIAGGEKCTPAALGRRKWVPEKNPVNIPTQYENKGAGHSDYWGGDSTNYKSLQFAVDKTRTFLDIGPPMERPTEERAPLARLGMVARKNGIVRNVQNRKAG